MTAGGRLDRMVIRVAPELRIALAAIARRLHDETGVDYPASSIVRGLLALGLGALSGREYLAPLFVGSRLKRGRKRGETRRKLTAPDVGRDLDDDEG